MDRSDAESLWEVASVLARDAAKVSRADGRSRPAPPPLLFFTDPDRTPRPWETAAGLPAGSGVVYRSFGAPGRLETAQRLREVTRTRGVLLLIGLDAALAEACGADGVHLPERALDQADALVLAHPEWRLTGAAHDAEVLRRCGALDAVVVSPVFQAGGVSAARPTLGLVGLLELTAASPCPVIALGGLNTKNARDLIGSGACGIAGVEAVQSAFGPD